MDDLPVIRDRVRSRGKVVIWTCLGLVFLALALFGLGFLFQLRATGEVRAEQEQLLAQLDAAGCAVSWDAWLARNPPAADAENGADSVRESISALRMIPASDDPLVPYIGHLEPIRAHERYSEDSLRAMASFTVTNQAVLDAYTRGMARPALSFSELGPGADGDERDGFRERLDFLRASLRVVADYAIAQGDPAQIRQALHAVAAAPGLYARSPVHAGFNDRMRAVMDYCLTVERALNHSNMSGELLVETQTMLAQLQPVTWFQRDRIPWWDAIYPPPPRDYLLGEVLQHRSSAILAMSPLPDSIKIRIAGRGYETCKVRLLRNAHAALRVSELTGAEYRSTWDAIWAVAGAAGNEMTQGIETAPFWDMGMLVHARTYQLLARIAVALEQYRMRHGAFPEMLEALESDAYGGSLLDPWDGKPVRYRYDRQGFLLYSVGGNLVDDGGVNYADRKEQKERGDIVFVVHPNPEVLRQ